LTFELIGRHHGRRIKDFLRRPTRISLRRDRLNTTEKGSKLTHSEWARQSAPLQHPIGAEDDLAGSSGENGRPASGPSARHVRVAQVSNEAWTQNGHIRNDTRDASRRMWQHQNSSICRRNCVADDRA
jgi:hypothetical protein